MTGSAPPARTVAVALSVTTAVQVLVTMASLTVSVYAPQAARDIGISPAYLGVYASLTYIGAMLGSLAAGGFIVRYGAIRFSQAAMVICAIGLALCIGSRWWWFLLSALVLGIGYGPTTPASSHILARHTPVRSLALVFSIKQTGVPMGGVLAGILVPALLTHFSWPVVTAIVALTVAAGAIGLQLWRRRFDVDLRPGTPLVRGNILGPLRLILSRPALRLLAIGTFFFSATQQCYIYYLVTYLQVGVGWSVQQAGFALSVLGMSAVAGRMLWGAVADASRQSRRVLGVLALGMAASTAVTTMFTHAWSAWSVYAVCAAFGATGAAWNGVYLAEITRHVDADEVGRATGGGLFVTFAGVVLAPPLFGILVELSGGFSSAYAALALPSAVVGLLFLLPGVRGRRRGVTR